MTFKDGFSIVYDTGSRVEYDKQYGDICYLTYGETNGQGAVTGDPL